ncbi:2-dehydropantoate 2-reductase [Pollutibacter soli]|uniref:ketopantoate reductase family protein n=1 Tax=Pollutibacter soli TaxID=3034157 RepID=UPI003013AE26
MQKTKPTIYIIGAGAIGKTLAVFLKQQGKDIVLLRGHIDNKPACVENIEVQLSKDEIIREEITLSCISNYPAFDGIVVLANKAYGNLSIAERLRNKVRNSPLVILQNGLNVELPFTDHKFSHVYRGVLFTTCQSLAENSVKFRPVTASPIGIISGNEKTLHAIVDQLNNPNLQFISTLNIHSVAWTKTIINCVFNSICPLLETDNGIFHSNRNALTIAKRIIDECVIIASLKNIHLNSEEILEKLLLISRSSDGQLISTYQDIINKRKTEIESFNFAITGIADLLQKKELVTETRLLGELIQIKSELTSGSV